MKPLLTYQRTKNSDEHTLGYTIENRDILSLSVVMPAYNEEQVIACTVSDILNVLSGWVKDFEVIVVDDGSTDQTASIVAAMSEKPAGCFMVTLLTRYGAARPT